MGFLTGQAPRGWPPGVTWDDIPGTFEPSKRYLLLGGGEHGSISLGLHETGHAINFLLGINNGAELIEHHVRLYDKFTDPYFRQGGPGGFAGRDEMFAESVAFRLLMGRKLSIHRYDKKYLDWLERILWHPPEAMRKKALDLREYAGARGMCRTGPVLH